MSSSIVDTVVLDIMSEHSLLTCSSCFLSSRFIDTEVEDEDSFIDTEVEDDLPDIMRSKVFFVFFLTFIYFFFNFYNQQTS